jgi:hypothetical protein
MTLRLEEELIYILSKLQFFGPLIGLLDKCSDSLKRKLAKVNTFYVANLRLPSIESHHF